MSRLFRFVYSPQVFSMASVSCLLQPGQSRSYEQILKSQAWALRVELHFWRFLQAFVQGLQHGEHG